MKREKRKRNNIFLSLTMLFAMFTFIVSPLGVYAQTVDGFNVADDTSCSSPSKIHTNFYLFLEDIYSNDGTTFNVKTGTEVDVSKRQKNFMIGMINSSDKIVQVGKIPLSTTGGDKTNTTSWSYTTFYDVYRQLASSGTSDADRVSNENEYHYAMAKQWVNENGDLKEDETQTSDGASTTQLIGATFRADIPITIPETPSNFGPGKTTIGINRDYSGAHDTTTGIPSDPYETNEGHHYYHFYHPALYMIRFCSTGEADKVQLHYKANGGELGKVPADSEKKDKGSDFTVDSNIPTRDGYVFMGWADSADATSGKYNGGDVIKNLTEDKTIYAIWEKADYGVNYDPNGGAGAPLPQAASKGECITISDVKPTKAGAKFLGWSLDPKATAPDSKFDAGKEYCDGKTITLYAVWSTAAASANPKTGVVDYAIAFGSIAAIAGAGLIVSKRKKLFKQI